LGPDLVEHAVAGELLAEDLHHHRLFDRLVADRQDREIFDDPDIALGCEFGNAEALLLGKLDVEFRFRIGEEVADFPLSISSVALPVMMGTGASFLRIDRPLLVRTLVSAAPITCVLPSFMKYTP